MDNVTVVQKVESFLETDLGLAKGFDRQTPLFSSGTLSSLDILSLLDFLHEQFAVEILPFEVGLENFDTIERIAALVSGSSGGE